MARIAKRKVANYLDIADNGVTTAERGRALEELVSYVFRCVPGVAITKRNSLNVFQSEEIDVAIWNDKHPKGLVFLPNLFLIECKNWGVPVGSNEVNWFDTKLRTRGLPFGVLVALNGITGDAIDRTGGHQIIAAALREQRQMIVVTRQEIETLSNSDQVIQLIKEKLCELAVTGTLFP
ncbi:MAG: restriction endonuclease [Candidatus Bathyarchaeia archaeon]|jgi:hypothetical protein